MPVVPSHFIPASDLEGCLTVVLLKDFLAKSSLKGHCLGALKKLLLFQGQVSGNKRYFASPLTRNYQKHSLRPESKTFLHFRKGYIIIRI